MTGERLNYLLRVLGTSGKELADQIGVDYSTLSKWRRDKRTLSYSSPYAKAIASWALNCPAERECGAVHKLLRDSHPELREGGGARLEHMLRLWLTMPDKPESIQTAALRGMFEVPLQSSIGLENVFDAQYHFFRLLRELPPGQQVTVADFGAVDWAHTEGRWIEEGVRINQAALSGGHSMRIIDQLTDTYRPWELMFQWLPMYLQPDVSTFFYRDPKPFPLRQNLMTIRGQAALIISSTPAAPERVIASLYRDPEYVKLFDAAIDGILERSHPMMQVMETGALAPFLGMIDDHVKSERILYMINRLPTFRNMPPQLLDEVLRENGVTGTLYERCAAAGRQSASTRSRCECRQIYDLDAIQAAAAEERVVDHDLSAVAGREIFLSREQFRQQLAYLQTRGEESHYTLAVYPYSRLETTVPPCNMIVQDDSLAAAWDASSYPRRMYSEELSIVSGFYEYADTLWECIPPIAKSESWCRRKIGALLT